MCSLKCFVNVLMFQNHLSCALLVAEWQASFYWTLAQEIMY